MALLLYGVGGLAATFSLLVTVLQNQFSGLVLVLFSAAAWLGVQNLGYAEFRTARRMLVTGAFQNMLNAQLALEKLDADLAAAGGPEECWRALEAASASLRFHRVEMALGGRRYARKLADMNGHGAWELRVPLEGDDFVRLVCAFHSALPPVAAGQLAEVLRARLGGTRFPVPMGARPSARRMAARAGLKAASRG